MRSNELVLGKTLTNGADRDEIMLLKYARTFSAVIEKADVLSLAGMGLGDKQALQAFDVALRHCAALKALDLFTTEAPSSPCINGRSSSPR